MWQCLRPAVIMHVFLNWIVGPSLLKKNPHLSLPPETTGVAKLTRTDRKLLLHIVRWDFNTASWVWVWKVHEGLWCHLAAPVFDGSRPVQLCSPVTVQSCRPWNLPSDHDLISFPKPDTNLQRGSQTKAEGQPFCSSLEAQVHQIQSNFMGFNGRLLMFHFNTFRACLLPLQITSVEWCKWKVMKILEPHTYSTAGDVL